MKTREEKKRRNEKKKRRKEREENDEKEEEDEKVRTYGNIVRGKTRMDKGRRSWKEVAMYGKKKDGTLLVFFTFP